MITVSWSRPTNIANLPELQRNVQEHGGKLVEYLRVWSVVVFTLSEPRIEWVRPGKSRRLAGLKHSFFSMAVRRKYSIGERWWLSSTCAS